MDLGLLMVLDKDIAGYDSTAGTKYPSNLKTGTPDIGTGGADKGPLWISTFLCYKFHEIVIPWGKQVKCPHKTFVLTP